MAYENENNVKNNGERKNRKRKRKIYLEKGDFIDAPHRDELEISPESKEEIKMRKHEEELDEAVRRKTRGDIEYEPKHPYCDDQDIIENIYQILERSPRRWEHFYPLHPMVHLTARNKAYFPTTPPQKNSKKSQNRPTKTTQETSPEDEHRNIFKKNSAQQ